MPVVALLGCWTAGKTSVVKRFQHTHPNYIQHIDSDLAVSEPYGGWLGNIFLSRGHDPSWANAYIDFRERYLLAKLLLEKQPCILAAGPLLPTREPSWSAFVNCAKPVCFYIQTTPAEIYLGLKKRRAWQKKAGLDLCSGFGSWDDGLLTRFDAQTGLWNELGEDEALSGITEAVSKLTPVYEKFATDERTIQSSLLKDNQEMQNKFDSLIEYYLQVPNQTNLAFES
jgi:shikimate kinase